MKIQILKSTQVNGKHCEILDVVEVEQAMASYLIDAKRAIAFKDLPRQQKRTGKKVKNVNSK